MDSNWINTMVEYALDLQWSTDRLNALWHLVVQDLDHDDLAHDWLHVKRVTEWAIRLAEQEQVSVELAGAAGMLHDIINIPKESDQRSMGSELSAQAGVRYLIEAQFQPDEVTAVTSAISTCSWSSGKSPTSRLGAILQDADRLDAIGALGFMRNIACAQAMRSRGNPGLFYHPERPVPFNEAPDTLNDKAYAIDHFFRKLQHLNQGMHTTMAKAEAHRRHQWMLEFLSALSRELS